MRHMPDSSRPVIMHVIMEYMRLIEDERNSVHLSHSGSGTQDAFNKFAKNTASDGFYKMKTNVDSYFKE